MFNKFLQVLIIASVFIFKAHSCIFPDTCNEYPDHPRYRHIYEFPESLKVTVQQNRSHSKAKIIFGREYSTPIEIHIDPKNLSRKKKLHTLTLRGTSITVECEIIQSSKGLLSLIKYISENQTLFLFVIESLTLPSIQILEYTPTKNYVYEDTKENLDIYTSHQHWVPTNKR